MAEDVDLLRAVERAPLRTARLQDLDGFTAQPWRVVNQLVDRGALTRLAHGTYTAPPGGRDGRTWKPPLEPAGLAVATARFGPRSVALTGIGAARHWAAIPRAIGVTTIAVQGRNYAPVTLDTGGVVQFVARDLERLDIILEQTALGPALVTTPPQTLFDLLMRPGQGHMPDEAIAATKNLAARVQADDLARVAGTAGRANAAVREMIEHLRERDAHAG
ncbi:type IV toxin-antitoxin system AbiEi family antitoxin domain-containing protein [Microbacterium pygmaeum]|uniref:Transcriptional regulator, AbiEi antitoxin, Type IV TA system n=1 Tax=Microbacterium pygmaeum TaxID=370764 RepID=A0A1G8DEZ0_9MICO|nr:hypothetical protein [Microbacterium pygmaeum]SDH56226.1 Transcriptional regulator, AbiEi antitoxin, Type IV TA system [Microbacterium pygmaeum]